MKLFVWNQYILYDRGPGIAIALAETVDEARKLLADEIGCSLDPKLFDDRGLNDPRDEVREVDEPCAFYKYGSM